MFVYVYRVWPESKTIRSKNKLFESKHLLIWWYVLFLLLLFTDCIVVVVLVVVCECVFSALELRAFVASQNVVGRA